MEPVRDNQQPSLDPLLQQFINSVIVPTLVAKLSEPAPTMPLQAAA